MLSESSTRKEIIDRRLRDAGWDVADRTQVIEEFAIPAFSYDAGQGTAPETREQPAAYGPRGFSDYVLLGRNGRPLATVEAKRSAKDAELGREQAKQYCHHIQSRCGCDLPFCFYTNGHDIHFWNLGEAPPQRVHGFPTRQDLERLLYIRAHKKPLTDELINTAIAGRDYQYTVTQLAIRKAKDGRAFPPDDDGFVRTSASGALTQDTKDILEQSLCGYDFDSTMVRLALMNLMMHGIDNPRIDYKDTLSKSFTESGEYDIVMANPPFTGSIDRGDINEELTLHTTKTELLFTERIFTLLKTGGTAGVIVPQGVLFGSGKAFVEARALLVDRAELKAVVSLPSGVFKPYAGVATAILIFTRGGRSEHTWFYQLGNDGLSLDDKRQRVPGSQLPDVVAKWKARDPRQPGDRKANPFFVPVQEIRDRQYDLSFNRYAEVEHDETEYEDPKIILGKLEALESKIQQGLADLKSILG